MPPPSAAAVTPSGDLAGSSARVANGPVGSAALFADYQRCLGALESVINGGLQRKKTVLADAAAVVEQNMSEVRRAAQSAQEAADEAAAGITERLLASQRHKMALLQHDLSYYMLEMDAIQQFVQQVMAYTAEPSADLIGGRAGPEADRAAARADGRRAASAAETGAGARERRRRRSPARDRRAEGEAREIRGARAGGWRQGRRSPMRRLPPMF